jgi:hypothetical protein
MYCLCVHKLKAKIYKTHTARKIVTNVFETHGWKRRAGGNRTLYGNI